MKEQKAEQRTSPCASYFSTAGGSAISVGFEASFRKVFADRKIATIAGPDEDPNLVPAAYASPPCFMHELDPSYLGYLRQEEVHHFLSHLLCGWESGIAVIARLSETTGGAIAAALRRICREDVAFHERLRGHLARLGGAPDRPLPAAAGRIEDAACCLRTRDALVGEIREVLPRIGDDALRQDLQAMVAAHERRGTEISVAEALRQLQAG